MSQSILKVHGIGPAAAAILAENGISSAEDLAAKTPLQVAAIKGFSEIRAAQVVASAKALMAAEPLVADTEAPEKKSAGKKSAKTAKDKPKKKKEKEKKKGKKSDKKEKKSPKKSKKKK